MGRNLLKRLGLWLLEIEMGFVWGVAGLSIIVFVFAAIWYRFCESPSRPKNFATNLHVLKHHAPAAWSCGIVSACHRGDWSYGS
jgi:hypothetical protein